jgi:hypothetical protein
MTRSATRHEPDNPHSQSHATRADAPLKTTGKQRGGVTGRGFQPGQSGNPGGRPRSERKLLERLYGEDGEKIYARLELLRHHPKTPAKLKAQIDFFLIERLHGRAQQRVEVGGDSSLVELLAAAATRSGA